MWNGQYLTNIPQECEEFGISKVLLVRYETINIKHIFTEIFVRKTIDINSKLELIGWNLNEYIEFMTNRIRRVYKFDRNYYPEDINEIVEADRLRFFPTIKLYEPLNNVIILDFDGVITKNSFHDLYRLCSERGKIIVCSANPAVSDAYFDKNDLPRPYKIYANKGKIKKMRKLTELMSKYDNAFYVDDEEVYLEFAWLFGIKTYKFERNQIKGFSLNTK